MVKYINNKFRFLIHYELELVSRDISISDIDLFCEGYVNGTNTEIISL